MGSPPPEKHVFLLTCTRPGDAAPHRFRVSAADAEHAVAIAKKQGLTVIEFRLEPPALEVAAQPAAPQPNEEDTYAIAPSDGPLRRYAPPTVRTVPASSKPPLSSIQRAVRESRQDQHHDEPAPPSSHRPRWPFIAGGVVLGVLVLVMGATIIALLLHRAPSRRPYTGQNAPGIANTSDNWYAPLFEAASPSCVTIRTRFGNGSGFAVKPYLICTNAHVVRGDSRRTLTVVQPESGQTANVIGVIHFDAFHDIAMVAVDKPFPVLDVAQATPPVGEALMAIGSPGLDNGTTLENSVSRLLAAKPVAVNRTTMLQLNGSVNPGNSGGPLLNRSGVVVGMITAKARDKDGIAFAVLPSDIREALEGTDRTTQEMRSATDQRHAAAALVYRLVYARAFEFALLRHWDEIIDTIPSQSEYVGHALGSSRADMEKEAWVQELRDRMRDDRVAGDIDQLEKDGTGYDVIAALRAFDKAVGDMAIFANSPRGTPKELREQIKHHHETIDAATSRICALLNMPEPDWEEVTE